MKPTGGQAPNIRDRSIEHENSQLHERLLDKLPLDLQNKILKEADYNNDPKTCKEHAFVCALRGQCDWESLVEKYRLSDGDVLRMCEHANKTTCSKQDDKKNCMRFHKQCCNETSAIRVANELGQEAELLLDAYPFLRNNKNVAIAVVSLNHETFKRLHEDLRGDKDVVLAAIRNDPRSLLTAGKRLQQDTDVLVAALSWPGFKVFKNYMDMGPSWNRLHETLMAKYVSIIYSKLEGWENISKAVSIYKNEGSEGQISDYLQHNPDFMRRMYLNDPYRAKRFAKGDAIRAIALFQAQLFGDVDEFVIENGFMDDPQFVIEAAETSKYKDYFDIRTFRPILKSASPAMRRNLHVVSSVVRRDWRNLRYANILNADIAISAITRNPKAFELLPTKLQWHGRVLRKLLESKGGFDIAYDLADTRQKKELPKVRVDALLEKK